MASEMKSDDVEVVRSYDNSQDEVAIQERPPVKTMDRIYLKLDFRILPPLWCLYFLSSFGAAAYGNALTMNYQDGHSLIDVIGATTKEISTATSLDFVGYIVFDLPMNLIMSRVSPHSWLARIIITIGVTYTCYAAIHNASGLMALRFFTGTATAGVWPGMAYYISMYYPDERTARRIGFYFIAAQISAAVAGLVAAGFQHMDTVHGYYGWQWLMIVYGVITTAVGISLFFWLPGRPRALENKLNHSSWYMKVTQWFPKPNPPLNEQQLQLHESDMTERYAKDVNWTWKNVLAILLDVRIYPLIMMYFGVVGVGFGIETFATTIIKSDNAQLSGIDLSLLTAPIWLCDALSIILITPLSDKIRHYRGIVFSLSTLIIIVGLFVATFAPGHWSRYGGLLICGFGLGPTVPINMTWASQIFYERHGDVGAAAATALVSGLGNLGSVMTTYALYTGWPADAARQYRDSSMVMVSILGISIIASASLTIIRFWLGDFKDQKFIDVIFVGKLLRRGR